MRAVAVYGQKLAVRKSRLAPFSDEAGGFKLVKVSLDHVEVNIVHKIWTLPDIVQGLPLTCSELLELWKKFVQASTSILTMGSRLLLDTYYYKPREALGKCTI